jgi:RNA polymerase sigma factor (sigma-70 family)
MPPRCARAVRLLSRAQRGTCAAIVLTLACATHKPEPSPAPARPAAAAPPRSVDPARAERPRVDRPVHREAGPEDADAPVAADVVDFGLLQDRLRSVLGTLPDRSAAVMRMRFGLDDGRARTLDEVGKELGLTRERIRQIERDTLKDLRKSEAASALKAWL